MGYLLAKSLIALSTLSLPPTTRPQSSLNLRSLENLDRNIQQLDQQLRQLNSQLNQIPVKPWAGITTRPSPLAGNQPFINIPMRSMSPRTIRPYGPSFQFNGLTVYIEPISFASPAQGNLR